MVIFPSLLAIAFLRDFAKVNYHYLQSRQIQDSKENRGKSIVLKEGKSDF
jgi:hypothetical protein